MLSCDNSSNDTIEIVDFDGLYGKIDLSVDSSILSGFKIQFKENQVFLDYTNESLSNSLSEFLRPELAKIVSEAINKD